MFVGRDKELSFLNEKYAEKSGNFILIYGRRRIGKTALVNKFIEDKKAIYLLATMEERNQIIRRFTQEISQFFNDELMFDNPFSDWDSFFKYMIEKIKSCNTKIIVVFDEITYIIEQDKSFLSILQRYFDLYLKDMNTMLILTGSLINVVYNDILSYKSPIFGRRTGNIELTELKFYEIMNFFPKLQMEDLIRIYAIYGGVPYYLGLLADGPKPIEKFVNKNNIYCSDVQFILGQELRAPEKYFTILRLIAEGKNNTSEISGAMGMNSNEISPYIDKLLTMRVISKEFPILLKKRNTGAYKITSNYFNFYFRFIFGRQQLLETGREDTLLKIITKSIDIYISKIFENICMELLTLKARDIFGFELLEIGRWWGRNPGKDRGKDIEEIDIVGTYEGDGLLFGEVKWRNTKIDIDTFISLKAKSAMFQSERRAFVIISKSGFEDELISLAAKSKEKLFLIGLNDMNQLIRTLE